MITVFKANAIGRNSKTIIELLEKEYQDNMTRDQVLRLVAQCFQSSIDNPKNNCQIAIVDSERIEFLTQE